MIDGIIFDKDGTLFDFRRTWADWAAALLAELADNDTARMIELGQRIGFDLPAHDFRPDSPVIADTTSAVARRLLPGLTGITLDALLARMDELGALAPLAAPVPLRPLMQGLRNRGIRLGVVTNDSEAAALAQLERSAVRDLFDFIAGYDSGHGAKPAPDPLHAFCAAAGLAPGRVLMVGDSLHDLEAARRAGTRAVAVLTGVATVADLAPHAEIVLPHIGELPGWLDQLAAPV